MSSRSQSAAPSPSIVTRTAPSPSSQYRVLASILKSPLSPAAEQALSILFPSNFFTN